jgi:hypothetical protein
MPGTDLDRRLRRLGEAAAAASTPRDPAATERAGRWRRRARRLGVVLALAGVAAALVVRDAAPPRPEPARPPRPAPATTQVAQDGLVVSVPARWRVWIWNGCPGAEGPDAVVELRTNPPHSLDWVQPVDFMCRPARYPVALLRSLPDANLPDATRRTVNGLEARVRQVPPREAAQHGRIPPDWSVWQAVLPTQQGGLLLQVADRAGAELFEQILATVRPGRDGGGAPRTRRVAWGGVSFEVPSSWQVVDQGENPCTVRSNAVFLGIVVDQQGCRRYPEHLLEVTRLRSAPRSSLPTLNGFGIPNGRGGFPYGLGEFAYTYSEIRLPGPLIRFRLLDQGKSEGFHLDDVLVSLRPSP